MTAAATKVKRARPVAPDDLTLRRVERALGERARDWEGRCFEASNNRFIRN